MSSSEDAALAQRLQAKDNALRSLTKRYLAYTAAVESSSEEECKALYEGLMLEVDQYELAVGKAEALVDTNVRQVAEYDDMQQRVEAEMCVDCQYMPTAAVLWRIIPGAPAPTSSCSGSPPSCLSVDGLHTSSLAESHFAGRVRAPTSSA